MDSEYNNSMRDFFNMAKKRTPIDKASPSIPLEDREKRPITYDDVLNFHLTLNDIRGIEKNEKDFFSRFKKNEEKI